MSVIATIEADLEVSRLGTRSRLADELAGITILRRTVERLRRAEKLDAIHVLCPTKQHERCTRLLEGTGAIIRRVDAPPAPWANLVRAARKWSLSGWRGGLGGTTSFDEYLDPRVIAGLLETVSVEAVLSVPPAAVLVDPELVDQMIEHRESAGDETRLIFSQAPPGVAGVLLETSLITELAQKSIPLGWVLSYKPDSPQKDLIFQPSCCETPAELRHATGRLIADTRRATDTLEALLCEHEAPNMSTIGRWLCEREASYIAPLPREVEIELTTDDPYPDALFRPRGDRVPSRGPIDLAIVEQIAAELADYDDALVVLGGFGDPLRHPHFESVLEALRPSGKDRVGVYGLAIRTAAVDLDEGRIEALVAHEVDVLWVTLDAWSPELYGRVQSPVNPQAASLDEVTAGIDRLTELCRDRHTVRPIVAADMTKARENVDELDAFFDGWLRRVGAATITGYSHRGGQCEDLSVIDMSPSAREPCRRLNSRCLVLADGAVVLCDQDFRSLHVAGRIGPQSLGQIWQGETLTRARAAHNQGRFDAQPLCPTCSEWHRP